VKSYRDPPLPASLTESDAAHLNNLRTRSLLSFVAVCLQIPAGWALRSILDHEAWGRRKRGLVGLTAVSVPLVAAWIWEMVSMSLFLFEE
jgi:hypothetical protein